MEDFQPVATIAIGPETSVLELGWQSWSPSGWYGTHERAPRPRSDEGCTMGYRGSVPRWRGDYQSEGALVVERGLELVLVSGEKVDQVPTIRASVEDDVLVVHSNSPVNVHVSVGHGQLSLRDWANRLASQLEPVRIRSIPPGWCSWYSYERSVSESTILSEAITAERLDLPIQVMLLDAGYESALGDWLRERDDFGKLSRMASSLRQAGFIPGIWVAPFIAASHSRVATSHPGWWLPDASAGRVWDSDLLVLDTGCERAVDHLAEVFSAFVDMGFGLFKLDFLYAGMLGVGNSSRGESGENREGYRGALAAIRAAIGPEPYLLGCGAPLIPSIGMFDAMRVSCDVGVSWRGIEASDGSPREDWFPSGRGALRSGACRAFSHGVWWVNDPDCIMARPQMERRRLWAEYLSRVAGVALSGDSLADLDREGLRITRDLLREARPEPIEDMDLLRIDQLGRHLPE
jgi:alpha-galactosidase